MVYEPIREIRWTNQKGRTAVSEVKNVTEAEIRMLRRHYLISAGDRLNVAGWLQYTPYSTMNSDQKAITQKYRYLSFGHISLQNYRSLE